MPDEIDNETTALVPLDSAAVKVVPADQLPDLDSMDEGMSLAPSYKEFREGVAVRAVFCGFSEMQSQNRTGHENEEPKMIPLGVFQSPDGVWVHAGANLVQQVRNVPVGTPLQITYKGKERTKRGNDVAVFDVRLLKAGDPNAPKSAPASPGAATAPAAAQPAQTAPASDKAPIELLSMLGAVARLKKVPDLDKLSTEMIGKKVDQLSSAEAETLRDYLKAL